MFLLAISHPGELIAAREAVNAEGSPLILDRIAPPPHPSHPAFGTVIDRLHDKQPREGLIEAEEVSEDGRLIDVTYWTEVDSEQEGIIVAALAYWSACWNVRTNLGKLNLVPDPEAPQN